MADRTYTLAEARHLLPQVIALVESLSDTRRRFTQAQALADSARRSAGPNGHGTLPRAREQERQATALAAEIQQVVTELNELGVEIKNLDRGLIDFPALREGRRVYLCWQQGEATIEWWHEIADGFAGRRRVVPQEWA